MAVDEKERTPKESKARTILNRVLKIGDAVGAAARLVTKVISIFNSRSIYEALGDVTPAANPNREMNPSSCLDFSPNGTTSVIRFADIDVEWTKFQDSYAVEEAAQELYEILRGRYKGNTPYNQALIKELLINSLFAAVGLLQLCRDVAWREHPIKEVLGFKELSVLRADKAANSSYYGFVDLQLPTHLADEEIINTKQTLQAILNDAGRLTIPSRLFEFVHHYFGELFVVDYDSFNDQYVRLIMHDMDFYDFDNQSYITKSINDLSLQEYAELITKMRVRYATVLADIKETTSNWLPITDLVTHLFDVNTMISKQPVPVRDRTFEQAITNGYSLGSADLLSKMFKQDYIRLDYFADVEDELTTYMFLGGCISDDEFKTKYKMAHPITVIREVVKLDSDPEVEWPALMGGTNTKESSTMKISGPFGYSFTSVPKVYQYTNKKGTTTVVPHSDNVNIEIEREVPIDGTVFTKSEAKAAGDVIYINHVLDCKHWYNKTAEIKVFHSGYYAYKFYGLGSVYLKGDTSAGLNPDDILDSTHPVTVYVPAVAFVAQLNFIGGAENAVRNGGNFIFTSTSNYNGAKVKDWLSDVLAACLRVCRHVGWTASNPEGSYTTYIRSEIFTDKKKIYSDFVSFSYFTSDTIVTQIKMVISTKKMALSDVVHFVYDLQTKDGTEIRVKSQEVEIMTPADAATTKYAIYGAKSAMGVGILPSHAMGYVASAYTISQMEIAYDDPDVTISDFTYYNTVAGVGISNFITNLTKYHIPLMIQYCSVVQSDDDDGTSTITEGTPELVKPDFIPFFYGKADLYSVMLKMIGSLFRTDKRES